MSHGFALSYFGESGSPIEPKFWLGPGPGGVCGFSDISHVRFAQSPVSVVEVAPCKHVDHVTGIPPLSGVVLALKVPDGDYFGVSLREDEEIVPDDYVWIAPDPPRWKASRVGVNQVMETMPHMKEIRIGETAAIPRDVQDNNLHGRAAI